MTAVHRFRQGVRGLLAFTQPVDETLASQHLTPELLALFKAMRRSEQLHSLNVLRAVLAQGPAPADLAAAALLHDVGKSRHPFPIWQKTLVVLVHAFAPSLFRRLSAGDERRFWTRPFAVSARHPAWGAEMVAQAGASEQTIWLVKHHADSLSLWGGHPIVHLLKRLKAADDAN